MAKKYLDYNGLSYLWSKITDTFNIIIDAQTVAIFAQQGWTPPSDSRKDMSIDQSTLDLYESLGWEE